MDIAPSKVDLASFIDGLKEQPLRALRLSVFAGTFLFLFGTIMVLIGKPILLWMIWLWEHYLSW